MNRRQKIIVSVTGIFIVLLLLVGLTYGYFLTKITGNTNNKSISVSTANLQLVYGDGNGELVSDGTIIPGTTVSSKTFTVTNEGNATTDYAVVLENYKIAYAMTSGEQVGGATTTLSNPDDFKLKITCTSSKDGKSCNGLDDTLPTTNDILLTNSIEIGEIQSYTLSLEYIETGTDQSNDMNKTIEGKINIIDTKSTVDIEGTLASYSTGDYVQVNSTPKVSQITSNGKYKVIGVEPGSHTIEIYSKTGTKKGTQSIEIVKGSSENVSGNTITVTDTSRTTSINITSDYNITIDESIKGYNPYKEGTLAYNIINNAMNETNGTIYSPTPLTTPAEEISGETEKTLSVTTDDYGISYYYRGGVEDNYVNFAGMCWRIVRIEGDGSTKLILEDRSTTCNSSTFTGNWSDGSTYTFDSVNSASFVSGSLATAFKTFQTSKLVTDTVDYTTKLKSGDWCFDDTVTSTSSYGYDANYNTVYTESEATNGWYNFKYFGAYTRIEVNKKPSLNCTGTKLTKYGDGTTDMYVATLTADEMSFAGTTNFTYCNYYLMDYYTKNKIYWWVLSPRYFNGYGDYAFGVDDVGRLDSSNVNVSLALRPAVTLSSSAQITSGDGTKNNPYEIGGLVNLTVSFDKKLL